MIVGAGPWRKPRRWRRLGAVIMLVVLMGGLSAAFSEWLGRDSMRSHPPTGILVAVGGHILHYKEQMPAGHSLGTVVLVHGAWTGHADLYSTLAPFLSGYRVIAVDRPGQGWSERAGGSHMASPALQAQSLMALLDLLAPEKVVLVAHSLAGALSAHIALERPERLQGLVLVDALTHPFLGDPPLLMSLLGSDRFGPIINRVIAIPIASALLQRGIELAFSPQPITTNYVDLSGLRLLFREVAFRSNVQDILAADVFLKDQAARYHELSIPAIAITGDQDALVSPTRNAVRFSREARRATLSVLPGVGHMPHHAAPSLIAKAVTDLFLRP
ncbi:alpha/beta fold hydrolase [Bosea sp. (in: a-proteobacteria)]|uniref:alpha/beta fold hydrolase n=1 Tax=Bosea sp. (in: a-proteobacteria) TaxID=1871050 RepID=UPI003F716222